MVTRNKLRKQEGEIKMARVKTARTTRARHKKILKQDMRMQEEKKKRAILENYG